MCHMNKPTYALAGLAAAAAIVAGVIIGLQNFDAGKIACEKIGEARVELQALYESGVNASVQVYAEERSAHEERLSQCLSASPKDPCAAEQSARDAAVAAYNGIQSPPDTASYAEFQTYFQKREEAYQKYRTARDALAACRAANPPKGEVPYEESDTKACFDEYDASMATTQDTFSRNTQTMRAALQAALAALDAREKACNPPKGDEQFTDPPREDGESDSAGGGVAESLMKCRLLDADQDPALAALRQRAAAIPAEIEAVQESIDNVKRRMSPLQRDLAEVDTYIPPESTKTQFEGALNALRAERKVSIESSLDFYKKMLERREAEKAALQKELSDVQAQIAARLAEIAAENAARQRSYPTALHQSKPDKCAYYHCHGMLCGKPDPAQEACGQGTTSEADIDCSQFFNSYLQAAGA